MGNPWKDVRLSDYENHMSLDGIRQLQELNCIMKGQFNDFAASSAMVLGVAGGNGLEHVDVKKYRRVCGIDVNESYLEKARERHRDLDNVLELQCLDVITDAKLLPQAELLIADLFVEYVGYEVFQNAIKSVRPTYVSCVIQINEADGFVSDSPYLHAFDRLQEVHHQMEGEKLTESLKAIGYGLINVKEHPMPNGKKLIRLDYSNMKALVINCSPVRNGATAEIVKIAAEQLSAKYDVNSICIDDYIFGFCRGCRACHHTAKCVMSDAAVIQGILKEFDQADVIISVAPSYWADVPGQFKAFIDRCTPWCNTHEPHATIPSGKKGYAIALRTGPNMPECERIIGSIEHFYGHLEIACAGHLGLTSIEYKENVEPRKQEIIDFCKSI